MPPDEEIGLIAFAYEDITVATVSIGGTAGTYDDARSAELTLETAQIRIRIDGSDPTPDVGHLIEIGDVVRCNSAAQVAAFRAIRTGGTSGALKATYFH